MSKAYKAYIDTNVIGGCFDKEFSIWSNKLIKNFYNSKIILYVSNLTQAEISEAPKKIKDLLFKILDFGAIVLQENEQSLSLAKVYIKKKILTDNYFDDARHIAIATVNNLDLILSWNFRHIVNYDKGILKNYHFI